MGNCCSTLNEEDEQGTTQGQLGNVIHLGERQRTPSQTLETREQQPTGLPSNAIPLAVSTNRRYSKGNSVLDPQTFEFVDALHLPREVREGETIRSDSITSAHFAHPVREKRNSLTSWLTGGLFSSRSRPDSSLPRSMGGGHHNQRNIKMLMSGAGESGKSTVIKQMKIIHHGGFTAEEIRDFKPQIHRNIQESMMQILDCLNYVELTRNEETLHAAWIVRRFKPVYEELESLPQEYVDAINHLWVEVVRNSFDSISRRSYILDSAPYFFDEIERISKSDYVPNNEDILRARLQTTGINEFTFQSGPLNIKMIDVGGQRPERRKWIETFDNVTTLIFCVALSEYDQMLLEEPRQNRLLESFQLWETVVNSKWFQKSSIVLFLNKKDIFRHKLRTNPLQRYFPEYNPPENATEEQNYECAAEFLKNKFLSMNYGKVQIYPFLTCATDTKNIDRVFIAVKDTILANNLRSAGIL